MESAHAMTQPILSFDHVHFAYDDQVKDDTLRDVSLSIAPRSFTAIVGPSGSGKTTLLSLAAGLIKPTKGTMMRTARMRMIFQSGGLLPWRTVKENVRLGFTGVRRSKREEEHDLHQMLTSLGLTPLADAYPRDLSGGQRQRVGIARALVSRPDLLLLDEPFSALDAETTLHLRGLIEGIFWDQQIAMLMVSHSIEDAVLLADRILVVADRRVKDDIPVSEARPRSLETPHIRELIGRVRALLPGS